MKAAARPWLGLVFKCLSVLALVFAFIFFMRMMDEQSENDKLRSQGVVSRALVTDKKQDSSVSTHRSGRKGRSSYTTTNELWLLNVRHVPKSTVKYADFPGKVKEANLPVAPPLTGDLMKDSANIGVMWLPKETYEKTNVGDMLTVVNTPWSSGSPVLVSEVEAFDPSPFYPRIGIALVLMVLFWLVGHRIGKARVTRVVAAPSGASGSTP